MWFRRRTPLAWQNLVYNRRRLAAALGGVAFAVVLMFAETGFQHALIDSSVGFVNATRADLIIVSSAYRSLIAGETFDQQRLLTAKGCPGVKAADPLYIQTFGTAWKGAGRSGYPLRVLGFPVSQPVFDFPDVPRYAALLEEPCTALFDRRSKLAKYGFSDVDSAPPQPARAELNGRQLRVVGTFALGTDFGVDGNAILSLRNFVRHFPDRAAPGVDPLRNVDMGIVRVEDPWRAAEVRDTLRRVLGPDVNVRTKTEFVDDEKQFINRNTGIGFIFQLGKWIGFLVGIIVCYQVLNADISDHMREYATLKAMGYRRRYFLGVVVQESLYLSLLGFLPGLLISALIYQALAWYTGLKMELTVPRAASLFVLTVIMCAVSGCLAIRKIFAADPAELY